MIDMKKTALPRARGQKNNPINDNKKKLHFVCC